MPTNKTTSRKKTDTTSPTQVELSQRAAALKAAADAKIASSDPGNSVRLMLKPEVLALIGVSYPTLWLWMREGKFPRSRVLGDQKIAWLSTEIEAYIANLPISELKAADPKPEKKKKVPVHA